MRRKNTTFSKNRRVSQKFSNRFCNRSLVSIMLIFVVCVMLLPAASYLLPVVGNANAQVSSDSENQRSNFWRAVRQGNSGYSAVSGPETNVLINEGGQNWRQMRVGLITNYGGWALFLALIAIMLFFAIRGRVELSEERSELTVPRWNFAERAMHWYTAILFMILAITGLSLLFGRAVLIPLLGSKGFALWAELCINIHNTVGPFFTLGVLAMLIFWVKNNIPKGIDFKWLAQGGGIFGKKHPSAEKANGGEKIWYWIVVIVGLGLVCITGLGLIGWLGKWELMEVSRASMQSLHQIHTIAAIAWIIVFMGHVYIGTIGTEGALEGMTIGRVSVEWAKQHHDLWYEKVKDNAEHVQSPYDSATIPPQVERP